MYSAKTVMHKGLECIELSCDSYSAIVAHTLGGNVLRLRQTQKNVEVFRFNAEKPIDEIADSIEIWGLPTMYFPNRLDNGVLKASDYTYHLPVNEKAPFNNTLHGFLHRRPYKIESLENEGCAKCTISYLYDENDEYFEFLPIKFKATLELSLDESGLLHKFTLENLSERKMPISVATHTTINAPFVDGARQEDIRLKAQIGKKCELDARCLPTENLLELTDYDREYIKGTKQPVLKVVDNEMYIAESMELDGKTFHGIYAEDITSKIRIEYEISDEYGFWIFWNQQGFEGYFCPEPMSAMINSPNLAMDKSQTGYREIDPAQSFSAWQKFSVK